MGEVAPVLEHSVKFCRLTSRRSAGFHITLHPPHNGKLPQRIRPRVVLIDRNSDRRLQPRASLGEGTARSPEPMQCAGEPEMLVRLVLLTPLQRGPAVIEVIGHPVETRWLLGAHFLSANPTHLGLHHLKVVREVAAAKPFEFVPLTQALQSIKAERLQ